MRWQLTRQLAAKWLLRAHNLMDSYGVLLIVFRLVEREPARLLYSCRSIYSPRTLDVRLLLKQSDYC